MFQWFQNIYLPTIYTCTSIKLTQVVKRLEQCVNYQLNFKLKKILHCTALLGLFDICSLMTILELEFKKK